MSQTKIILHFGLDDGRNADALIAGKALIAWVELAREAAKAVGDEHLFAVELLSAERSSLRFTQLLRQIDGAIASIRTGSSDYPNLSSAALALALAVTVAGVNIAAEATFMPDATVKLSEEDRALLRTISEKAAASPKVKQKTEVFFRTVEQDPAIKEVGIAEESDQPPLFVVPRERFAERGGLWVVATQPDIREREQELDVVLVKPDLRSTPRSWSFQRPDGTALDATMADPDFLAALGGTGIPARLREGISMRIVIAWQESEEPDGWRYVNRSRRVVRVISPPPGSASPAPTEPGAPFTLTNPPEEN